MGPIDYSLNIANPLQSVLQGFQLGQQMRQQREQQAQAQREAQVFRALANPNADFKTVQAAIQAVPQKAEAVMKFWQGLDENRKNTWFDAGTKALQGIRTGADGKIDATQAVTSMREYSQAAANSGDKATAKTFEDIAKVIETDPASASAVINFNLGTWDADRLKKFKEATATGGGDVADLDKGYALNVKLYGKAQADEWRKAEEAKKGIITATGPLGTSYVPALKVAPMLAAGTVAGAAPESPGPVETRADGNPAFLTPAQYQATVAAMGKERTDEYLKTNGIAVIEDKSTVSGKTYYKIGGKWFDNPEGR